MKKALTFTLGFVFLFGISSLTPGFTPSLEAASIGYNQNLGLPENYNDFGFYDPKKYNDSLDGARTEGTEGEEEEEEGNPDVSALSLVLPGPVAREIRKMRDRVEALVNFNRRRAGGAAFGLVMIAAEKGDAGKEAPLDSRDAEPRQEGKHPETRSQSEDTDLPVGDLNGNGTFDFEDSVIIAQIAYGTRGATEEELAAADLNGDGEVNRWDAFLGALVHTGVLTLEEARDATPESLGLDDRGNYSHIESTLDPDRGEVAVRHVAVGNFTDEDIERMMKTLVDHLRRLLELMADLMGAESASGEGLEELGEQLVDLYSRFDRYVLTGVVPTY